MGNMALRAKAQPELVVNTDPEKKKKGKTDKKNPESPVKPFVSTTMMGVLQPQPKEKTSFALSLSQEDRGKAWVPNLSNALFDKGPELGSQLTKRLFKHHNNGKVIKRGKEYDVEPRDYGIYITAGASSPFSFSSEAPLLETNPSSAFLSVGATHNTETIKHTASFTHKRTLDRVRVKGAPPEDLGTIPTTNRFEYSYSHKSKPDARFSNQHTASLTNHKEGKLNSPAPLGVGSKTDIKYGYTGSLQVKPKFSAHAGVEGSVTQEALNPDYIKVLPQSVKDGLSLSNTHVNTYGKVVGSLGASVHTKDITLFGNVKTDKSVRIGVKGRL